MKILKQFTQSKEHANAQCCIVCLMSHGEEGSLTVQDGKKVRQQCSNDLSRRLQSSLDLSRSRLRPVQQCQLSESSRQTETVLYSMLSGR